MGEVSGEVGIHSHEVGSEIHDLTEETANVGEQGSAIEDEDAGTALFRSGQEQENDEEHNGSSKLGAIVGADLDTVLQEGVNVLHVHLEGSPIASMEGDVLGKRIQRGHCGC